MKSRRKYLSAFLFASLLALCLPLITSAQNNPWYRGNRDRDYRRDDDAYGRRNDRYNDYDSRSLRDAARRIKDRSHDFERSVDRYLDHSRYDGSRREDRINDIAKQFHNAADRFEDRLGNGRNADRSAGEARNMIELGSRINDFIARSNADPRTWSDWAQIRQDLNFVANFYNYRGSNDGYDRDGDYGRRGGYEPRRPVDNGGRWRWPRY